jgi:hypothetical protein
MNANARWTTALLTPLTAAILATSCDVSGPDRPEPAGDIAWTGTLTATDLSRLAGEAVATETKGSWVVRVAKRSGTDSDGSVAERRVYRLDRAADRPAPSAGPASGSAGPGTPSADPSGPAAELAYADDGIAKSTAGPTATATERDQAPLRAGSTDDNADHGAFVEWLQSNAPGLGSRVQQLDVRERRTIEVLDAEGYPVPDVAVRLVDVEADTVAWSGRTLGDGRFSFFPDCTDTDSRPAEYLVEARLPGTADIVRQQYLVEDDVCSIRLSPNQLQGYEQPQATPIDVVFVIDTTGSMGDEIARVKQTLLTVTGQLRLLKMPFSLRYGAVLYRDVGDEYVTMQHTFTDDVEAFDKALQDIAAAGGGDGPESLNQGLAVAVDGMEWREQAAKVAFLIADAPPHMDYENDVPYGDTARRAIERGIRIHSVAASGLDTAGSIAFRQIAHHTRGEFVFIEYGGDVVASGEEHGVGANAIRGGNNLDQILERLIAREITGYGLRREG